MMTTSIVSSFSYARETGVLTQITSYSRLDLHYLAGVVLCATLISSVSALDNLACLSLVFPLQSTLLKPTTRSLTTPLRLLLDPQS